MLRPYQLDGVAYLRRSAEAGLGACLADDMGLGKTLQVLAAVDSWKAQGRLGEWPAMIVMPASLLQTWKNEAARFAPGLLGSLAAFRRATDGGDRIATVRRLTRPFILRRLKTDRRIIADRAHLWFVHVADQSKLAYSRAKRLVGRGVPAELFLPVFQNSGPIPHRLAGDGSPHQAPCHSIRGK